MFLFGGKKDEILDPPMDYTVELLEQIRYLEAENTKLRHSCEIKRLKEGLTMFGDPSLQVVIRAWLKANT